MLIATHDSATGEKGKGIISWLLTPFAKTQSKTIIEQYNAGCRMFDMRFKEDRKGNYHAKHGLWTSEDELWQMLYPLNVRGGCYVSLTYEGIADDKKKEELLKVYQDFKDKYPKIKWQYLAVKYGIDSNGVKCKYDFLKRDEEVPNKQGFFQLDGRSWHTYLPIPWLWKKIYHDKPVFNDEYYTYVDFL